MGTEPESVDAQKGTMKDVLVRCLKKNEAHVCTYITQNMCDIVKRDSNLITSITGRPTFKIYVI